MYQYHARTPAELAIARNKNKRRHNSKLQEIAEEKAKLREGIMAINAQRAAEEAQENRQKVAELILDGKVAVEQLTLHGWGTEDILAVQAGNHKEVARKRLAPIAMQRIEAAIMSDDEKNAIVASKIVIDMVEPTKEEIEQQNALKTVETLPLRDKEILERYTNQPKERTEDEL